MGWVPIKHGELRDGAKLRLGAFTLVVHRVVTAENLWFATVRGGPINTCQLQAQTLEEAEVEALAMFKQVLREALNAASNDY
jgi:hypothetical protein